MISFLVIISVTINFRSQNPKFLADSNKIFKEIDTVNLAIQLKYMRNAYNELSSSIDKLKTNHLIKTINSEKLGKSPKSKNFSKTVTVNRLNSYRLRHKIRI